VKSRIMLFSLCGMLMLFVRYNCRLHFGELFQPAKLDDGRSSFEGSRKIQSEREISGLLSVGPVVCL